MLRTTLAGLRAHKLRLLLSAVAVILGVGFVSGTMTFSDTAKAALFDQFAHSAQHVDAAVQPPSAPPAKDTQAPTLPESLLPAVRAVPGAAAVEGRMTGMATLLDKTGKPITNGTSAGIASDVPEDPRFRSFTLRSGRLPQDPGEALLDVDTVATHHFAVGDTLTVLDATGARHSLRLVGAVDIGVSKGRNGLSTLELSPAALASLGIHGYERIDVAAASGVSQDALSSRVSAAVGSGYTVVTGATLAHDLADSVLHSVDIITTAILLFAVIAMFVAAIVIFNTFNILVTQRMREMALLRCVGATGRQVFGSVLVESVIVGLIGSAVGVFAGLGLTLAMTALFNVAGAGLPAGGLVVTALPILVGMLVGTVVTVISAIVPAARATRIAPIAALRAPAENRVGQVRHAVVLAGIAVVFAALGIAVAAMGLNKGRTGLFYEVGGALVFFVGIVVASPLLVGPLARFLGWAPGRLFGVPARLAVANSHRNPGRAAATMIALTVGVGVITVASVVTSTAHSYAFSQLDHHYPADYILTPLYSRNATQQPTLPPRVAQQLRTQPQVSEAAEMRRGTASSNGVDLGVLGVDPSAYGVAWRPDLSAGSVDSLATGTGSVALLNTVASRLGVGVGSTLQVRMGHDDRQMRVAGLFASRFGGEEALVSWQDFNASFGPGGDDTVLVKVKPGTSIVDGQGAIDRAIASDPLVAVQSIASYKTQITSSIDNILALFAGLLAVAIVIALFGIANTLSLSVIERTRESGLLRALGLTRSQLRGMLGAEALLLGLMGGLIGVVIGIGFGWAVGTNFIRASGGSGIGSVSYPVTEIVAYVVLAAVAGLMAGVLPARKAAKASVIDAIAET